MRIVCVVLGSICLAGCVSVTPVSGPEGKTAYSIECGRHRTRCLERAGELCPTGYQVVDSNTGVVGVPINGAMMMTSKETLTVSCK